MTGNSQSTYLDFNAGARLRPQVLSLMGEVLVEAGNASSVHAFGRAARHRIEAARIEVAALVGASPSQVVFTSGGTEANNQALHGMIRDDDAKLLVSAVEHDSVVAAAPGAQQVPVGRDGLIDLEELRQRLARLREDSQAPILVSVMLANNETGVISPLREVADTVHAFGALLHCDAVQAAGKIPVDRNALGIDLLTLSSHKLGGPQGAGALVLTEAQGLRVSPLICGGGQERGLRAGTENVAAIAGFGLAAKLAREGLGDTGRLASLRDGLESDIRELAPGTEIFGHAAPRLPNTSCFTMPGVLAETQVMALDLEGVAISAGAACSSGKVAPSRVLRAMGADEDQAASAIRVSFGWSTEKVHIDHFLQAWSALYSHKGVQITEPTQSTEAA